MVAWAVDWDAQVNLLIDTPDEDPHNPLWDLELGNGNSYYSHVCAPHHVLMMCGTPRAGDERCWCEWCRG